MGSLKCCALLVALSGLAQPAIAQDNGLLDFTADWCGPCQSMRPHINRLQSEGYPVRVVNIDREPKLAAKYGVTTIPCFVAVANGREVARQVGFTSYEHLVSMLGQARSRSAVPSRDSQDPFLADNRSQPPRELADLPPTKHSTYPDQPAAPQSPPARPAAAREPMEVPAPSELSAELVASTVRIRVEESNGHSFGTGTMIDARQGEVLILTCGHLFRDSGGKGRITVDFVRDGQPANVEARLVSYDLKRDLGLLSMRSPGRVELAPVAPAERVTSRGDWVLNVGCNNGQAPTPRSSRVTSIDKYLGPANFEVAGTPVEGRSGGGLFNQHGELIGVCFAADPADNEGVYAALKSIHAELSRLGLHDIAKTSTAPSQTPQRLASNEPPSMPAEMPEEFPVDPPGVRSVTLETPAAVADLPMQLAGNVEPATDSAPVGELTPAERATLAEIATRSRDAEVVCVIRPLNDRTAKSEIIVLDRASPEFLRQLTQRKRVSDSRQLTSHEELDEPARPAASAVPPSAPAARPSVYGERR